MLGESAKETGMVLTNLRDNQRAGDYGAPLPSGPVQPPVSMPHAPLGLAQQSAAIEHAAQGRAQRARLGIGSGGVSAIQAITTNHANIAPRVSAQGRLDKYAAS
jgi:hypothetical protein